MALHAVTDTLPRSARRSGLAWTLGPGTLLGRYRLLTVLASGGMGSVWVARDVAGSASSPNDLAAVKVIRAGLAEDAQFRRMFLDEARLAGLIQDPHVVRVFGFGDEGSVLYQAMELVEGVSLAGLLKRQTGPLPVRIAILIVLDALRGLHAAHELRDDTGAPLELVHRDVSPQNILLSVEGCAKITDFGIAKALGRLQDETETGAVKGKLAYMAPEQLTRRSVDRRSDVFAAGVVLWELLTGERLFRGEDFIETMNNVVGMAIPDPRQLVSELPLAIANVAMTALDRSPARRFTTAAGMRAALERAASAEGLLASPRELADYVAHHCAADLEPLHALVRDVAPAALPTEVPRPTPRRARLLLAGVVVALGATAMVPWLGRDDRASATEAATPEPAASAEGAGVAASAVVPVEPPAIDPRPATAAAATATPRAAGAVPPSRTAPRKASAREGQRDVGSPSATASAPVARSKFGNPYAP